LKSSERTKRKSASVTVSRAYITMKMSANVMFGEATQHNRCFLYQGEEEHTDKATIMIDKETEEALRSLGYLP